MAVTILQNPSSISLAGNPVILRAYTNLSNQTFLKICIRLSISLYKESTQKEFSFDLSAPTSGGAVNFDLSSFLKSALTQQDHDCLGNGKTTYDSSGYVRYSYKAWDEYLDENNATISSETTYPIVSGTYYAIPGEYTEIQRLILPEDTQSFLGSAKIMSNKPDRETIQSGDSLIIPMFNTDDLEIPIVAIDSQNEQTLLSTFVTKQREISFNYIDLSILPTGEYSIVFQNTDISPVLVSIIPKQPFSTYFEFYNRLGGMESIACYSRHSHKVSIKSERNLKYQEHNFSPTGRYFKHVSSSEQTIAMSTGPVSREWAKWFVQDFFQSEKVWMKDNKLDIMLPVIVEFDEEVDLYSEGEAQLIELKFDIVKSINGYSIGNFTI